MTGGGALATASSAILSRRRKGFVAHSAGFLPEEVPTGPLEIMILKEFIELKKSEMITKQLSHTQIAIQMFQHHDL